MVSAYVAEKRYVNFREMIRVADARSARENEDENTVRSWLEYLVDMKGARRERNATDVIGPAPGVTTWTLSSSS